MYIICTCIFSGLVFVSREVYCPRSYLRGWWQLQDKRVFLFIDWQLVMFQHSRSATPLSTWIFYVFSFCLNLFNPNGSGQLEHSEFIYCLIPRLSCFINSTSSSPVSHTSTFWHTTTHDYECSGPQPPVFRSAQWRPLCSRRRSARPTRTACVSSCWAARASARRRSCAVSWSALTSSAVSRVPPAARPRRRTCVTNSPAVPYK